MAAQRKEQIVRFAEEALPAPRIVAAISVCDFRTITHGESKAVAVVRLD